MWWQQPFRMFQTNLREIDAGFDVEKTADYLAEFGADTWLLSIGGIVSNYPTNAGLPDREPGPGAAGLRRPGRRRRRQPRRIAGIRVVGRMDFSKIDHRRFEQRPDWCFVNADGANQVYNGLISTCPSGEYYQERVARRAHRGRLPLRHRRVLLQLDVVQRGRLQPPVLGRVPVPGVSAPVRRTTRPACSCPIGPDSAGYDVWRQFAHQTLEELTGRVRRPPARAASRRRSDPGRPGRHRLPRGQQRDRTSVVASPHQRGGQHRHHAAAAPAGSGQLRRLRRHAVPAGR